MMNKFLEPNVLLLGCGYTLQRLATRLDPATFIASVTTIDKRDLLRGLGYNAEIVNLENPDDLIELMARNPGIDTIVDSVPPIADSARSVESICTAIAGSKVSRVIYLSTSGVFGGVDGVWVDENTKPNPLNAKARARLLCEERYRTLESAGVNVSALRIPAIYSEQRGLRQALASKNFRMLDGGTAFSNRIHVDDLVEVLAVLLTWPLLEKLPAVIPVCDDEPVPYAEIVKYYCETYNYPMPVSVSRKEVSAHELTHFMTDQRVSNKLMKSLGVKLKFPNYRCLPDE